MQVAVWDTYVTKKDGTIMHFDIIAPEGIKDAEKIYAFGRSYLKTKGEEGQPLSSEECTFCHIESLQHENEEEIKQHGYYIVEMENCD